MSQEKIEFLRWLINRLQYKYHCDSNDNSIQQLEDIISILRTKYISIQINDNDLDKIINQYYADFTLDKCNEINIGFSEAERICFRNNIRYIVDDIVNKNIPKDFLIKG